MKQLNSVGIIVFRESPSREYLVLQYSAKHWDFPKGGVERGEEEKETALRELREETGISEVQFVQGFREEISYFYREGGELVKKTAVFYLAKTTQEKVVLSFEHIGYKWLKLQQALRQVTYKNARELLKKAEGRISKNTIQTKVF